MLFLTDELLLRLRFRRVCSGSTGLSPLTRAKRFSMSVRLTTPLRRPLMVEAPGKEAAPSGEGEAGE